MVKVECQPIEGRQGSETWDMVVRREERGWREGTGKGEPNNRGQGPLGGGVRWV